MRCLQFMTSSPGLCAMCSQGPGAPPNLEHRRAQVPRGTPVATLRRLFGPRAGARLTMRWLTRPSVTPRSSGTAKPDSNKAQRPAIADGEPHRYALDATWEGARILARGALAADR